jgi:hypothetical protein
MRYTGDLCICTCSREGSITKADTDMITKNGIKRAIRQESVMVYVNSRSDTSL